MSWKSLNHQITHCERCPRLRVYCAEVARVKRRQYREEIYWGRPVPGFGDAKAKLWIWGLAPAAHGANRTGRMFTGDSSGNWLYRALHDTGFANQPQSENRDDGLILTDAYVTATARCAPPDNKPTKNEIANCASYLRQEARLLKNKKVFLALGLIGFEALWKWAEEEKMPLPTKKPKFAHGLQFKVGDKFFLASYHPSRQNTQTGRLTWAMWVQIFKQARKLMG